MEPRSNFALDTVMGGAVSAMVGVYQQHVPARFKRHCLYEPSCSRYTVLAIAKHGTMRGLLMGFQRIRRCRAGVQNWLDYP